MLHARETAQQEQYIPLNNS